MRRPSSSNTPAFKSRLDSIGEGSTSTPKNNANRPRLKRRKLRRPPRLLSSSSSRCADRAPIIYFIALLAGWGLLVFRWTAVVTPIESVLLRGSSRNVAVSRGTQDPPRDSRPPQQPRDSPFQRFSENAPECSMLQPDEVSYTLVTQLSTDRLWMMEHHCSRWGRENLISLAVLVEQTNEKNTTHTAIMDQLLSLGCNSDSLTLQLLTSDSHEHTDYPVNVLRVLALSAVTTSHVVYVDVDFWESSGIHDILSTEDIRQVLASDDKLALVLPAFQLNRQCKEYRDCREDNIPKMPLTASELFSLLKSHSASPFDPTNRGGHGSTRYREWLKQSTAELLQIPCVLSNRYEPYTIFRFCRKTPPFQTVFSGYGKNKMTMVMHMRRQGYIFQQLGGAFVIHYPHLDSDSRVKWNEMPDNMIVKDQSGQWTKKRPSELSDTDWKSYKRGQVDALFVDFRNWLYNTVPDQSRVPMCEDAQDDDAKLWIDRDA